MHPTIDDDKRDPRRHGWIKYVLANAVVYQSPAGYCFTDYLDELAELDLQAEPAALTEPQRAYLAHELSSNRGRVERQLRQVWQCLPARGARVLDVGCGSGLFAAQLARTGVDVDATELNPTRVQYAREVHGLRVERRTLEDPYFAVERAGRYHAITLWDTLEHVNFPLRTLRAVAALLAPGGTLLLDTPCRDGDLHRLGSLGYRLSRGRFPTLLNLMYSNHEFGHKQIFTRNELRGLLEHVGLQPQTLQLFHELAMPTEHYLAKLTGSLVMAQRLAPAARRVLSALPLRNKLLAIARKTERV